MKKIILFAVIVFLGACAGPQKAGPAGASLDPHQWMEEVNSEGAQKWADSHNAKTMEALGQDPRYSELSQDIKKILTAKDRIPTVNIYGEKLRNFWQDEDHVRGILRQTTIQEYAKDHPRWELLLDVDALNKAENKSWVFKGSGDCLPPEKRFCLVELSDGGKDESTLREFDMKKKTFVKAGFIVPQAKSDVAWLDHDTLYIGTNFGPESLTTSGYPRQVRVWKRGTPLSEAKLIYEGEKADVLAVASVSVRPESKYQFLKREIDRYRSENYLLIGERRLKLPFPDSAKFTGDFKKFLLAELREDWRLPNRILPAGAVISLPVADVENPNFSDNLEIVYQPDSNSAIYGFQDGKDFAFLTILHNVRGEVHRISRGEHGWSLQKLPLPDLGRATVAAADRYSNRVLISYEGFLDPPSLFMANAEDVKFTLKKLKSLPPRFAAEGMAVEQYFAKSKDGTLVPYFLVHKKDYYLDGNTPTLLYGYGGFEVSLLPSYLSVVGKVWLEKGGAYALANIRGGGEFGPKWHEAALKENRQRAYEDFAAIAEDLFSRKVTSPEHLGIQGGSNGGLLVGVSFTQHPDYYKAVICESALLDMARYQLLPPGASWIGEYGTVDDPKTAAAIGRYSPYQNLKAGTKYPKVFFHISTADDRVLPGHTRKMVARMEELGNDVLVYENREGGHGGAADIGQTVRKLGLEFTYLDQQLMNK